MSETKLPRKNTVSKHEFVFDRGFSKFEFSLKNCTGVESMLVIRLQMFGDDQGKAGRLARNSSVSLIVKDQSNCIVMHKLIQEMSGASDVGRLDETATFSIPDGQTATLKGFVFPSSEQSDQSEFGVLEAKLTPAPT